MRPAASAASARRTRNRPVKSIRLSINTRPTAAFFGRWLAIAVLAAVLTTATDACADVIVMKNGKRITTKTYWIDGKYVKFKVQGLDAGVPRKDVLRIEKESALDSDVQVKQEMPSSLAPVKNRKTPDPVSEGKRPPESIVPPTSPAPRANIAPVPTEAEPGNQTVSDNPPKKNRKHAPVSKILSALPEGRLPTGFRSLYWGMPQNEIPALNYVGTDSALGGIDQFVVPDEHLRFGSAPVSRIVYGFGNNKLLTITFWVFNRDAYERLKKEVFGKYGEGHRNVDGLERIIWPGGPTDRLLEYDAEKQTGLFWLRGRRQWKSKNRSAVPTPPASSE